MEDKENDKVIPPWAKRNNKSRKATIEAINRALSPEEYRRKIIKKIIAREGLIILAIILIGVIWGDSYFHWWWKEVAPSITVFPSSSVTYTGAILEKLRVLIGIYCLSWIVRFIIWALKTLRGK
jgi:hypothetical protein